MFCAGGVGRPDRGHRAARWKRQWSLVRNTASRWARSPRGGAHGLDVKELWEFDGYRPFGVLMHLMHQRCMGGFLADRRRGVMPGGCCSFRDALIGSTWSGVDYRL